MRIAAVMIATTVMMGSSVKAQDKAETTVYKVDFNIHDGRDRAAKDGRRYTLLVRNNNKSTFRVGDKIPYATGSGTQAAQYSYLDTGVNIDCVARELNDKVALFAEVELSSPGPRSPTGGPNPTVAQSKFVINTVLTQGQPMIVASFDDPVTSRKLDVEATVSKIN
jgi:hypothetical protein